MTGHGEPPRDEPVVRLVRREPCPTAGCWLGRGVDGGAHGGWCLDEGMRRIGNRWTGDGPVVKVRREPGKVWA